MWWKIYFWVYTVLTVLGIVLGLFQFTPLTVYEILAVVVSIILCLGTYAFVFKKKLFSVRQWQFLFRFTVGLAIIELFEVYVLPKGALQNILPFWTTSIPLTGAEIVISWLISLPALYALHKLSKK